VDLLWDLCSVRVSLGALSAVEARVSDAIEPAVDEAWNQVGQGEVKHTDGTSWLQAGAVRVLWTIATKAATVFKILADGSKATWHDYRAGKLARATFVAWMRALGTQVEAVLARGVAADIDGLSGSCADVLEHRQALWTFVDHDGVDPTNNHAEREIRAFVPWRKRSFGAQSERGNVFAERVMTVAHTARKQNKNVLAFLTACCLARAGGSPPPSLFAADVAVAA
jgi:transposase